MPLPARRYWQGTYWASLDPQAKPVLTRTDPVLNFSYRGDLPLGDQERSRVEWRGTLHIIQGGHYGFVPVSTGNNQVELRIDGKKVAIANQEAGVLLKPGDHPAVVKLLKQGGFVDAFHLAWRPPGRERYEILPPEALR